MYNIIMYHTVSTVAEKQEVTILYYSSELHVMLLHVLHVIGMQYTVQYVGRMVHRLMFSI